MRGLPLRRGDRLPRLCDAARQLQHPRAPDMRKREIGIGGQRAVECRKGAGSGADELVRALSVGLAG
jgi:hypothetical protein